VSLLFDQNLSRRLPSLVANDFPGSEHVLVAGLSGADDRAVWELAASKGLTIVSKDSDFLYLSSMLKSPPKVIWLRSGNCSTKFVATLLTSRSADIKLFLADPSVDLLELP